MAISGKKLMPFLGVFVSILMAVLLVVATEGAVTIYNPERIPALDVLVDGERLRVESGVMSVDVTGAEQVFNITLPTGGILSIDVENGEIILFLPDGFLSNLSAPVRVVPVPVPVPSEFDFSLPAGEPRASP